MPGEANLLNVLVDKKDNGIGNQYNSKGIVCSFLDFLGFLQSVVAVAEDTDGLPCPWCAKDEVLTDTSGKVIISMQCFRCGHIFRANLYQLKIERTQPQRRLRNTRC